MKLQFTWWKGMLALSHKSFHSSFAIHLNCHLQVNISLSFAVTLQFDGFKRPCHKGNSLCWKAVILFNNCCSPPLIVILVLWRAVLENISLWQSSKSYSQEKPFTVLFLAYCEKMSMSTLPLRSSFWSGVVYFPNADLTSVALQFLQVFWSLKK